MNVFVVKTLDLLYLILKNKFVLNIVGYFLYTTGFVLIMTGMVPNMTGLVPNMTGFVLK